MSWYKKNKLLIIVVLIIAIIVGTIVIIMSRHKTDVIKKQADVQIVKQKVFADQVKLSSFNSQENTLYYYNDQNNPGFFKYSFDNGENKQLNFEMTDVSNVKWSPDYKKAIIEVIYNKKDFKLFHSPFYKEDLSTGDRTYWLQDFSNNQLLYLFSNIQDVMWLNNDQLILSYVDTLKNTSSIYSTDPIGANRRELTQLENPLDYFLGSDQDAKNIYFVSTVEENMGSNIYSLNLENKTIAKILDQIDSAFLSPKTKIILYNKYLQPTTTLLYNLEQKNSIELKQILDLSVVAYNSADNTIYSPVNSGNGDNIMKININQLTSQTLKTDSGLIQNIFYSSNSKTLYFTSNDFLYKIGL